MLTCLSFMAASGLPSSNIETSICIIWSNDMNRTLLLCAALAVSAGSVTAQQSPRDLDRVTLVEDGYHINVFHDGSASVALGADIRDFRWSIDCSVDAMTDQRKCGLHSGIGGLIMYYGNNTSSRRVCIFGHDYRNRRGMIRIDKTPAQTTDLDGCVETSSIWPQLMKGQSIVTRRYQWPSDYPQDRTSTLDGLAKADEVIGRILSGQFAK